MLREPRKDLQSISVPLGKMPCSVSHAAEDGSTYPVNHMIQARRFRIETCRLLAYATDLRWRIIYQRLAQGYTYQMIARNLNVSSSTVHRICNLFDATGDVQPVDVKKPRPDQRNLDEHNQLYVIGLIMDNPSLYLAEMCQHVH